MKTLAIVLWSAQLLAAIGMSIAALVDIESIVVTGPLLTVCGLLLAAATRCVRSKLVLSHALSGPLMCSLCAILILTFKLSPPQAQWPIAFIIVAYTIADFVFAAKALILIRALPPQEFSRQPFVWKYSLKSMLILMTAVSVVIVVGKLMIQYLPHHEWMIFGGFTLVSVVLIAVILWRFFATPDTEIVGHPGCTDAASGNNGILTSEINDEH